MPVEDYNLAEKLIGARILFLTLSNPASWLIYFEDAIDVHCSVENLQKPLIKKPHIFYIFKLTIILFDFLHYIV